MNNGKLPPQATELEELIIAALIMDKHSMEKISDLKPEMFYKNENKIIFAQIIKMVQNNKPFDLVILIEELKKENNLEKVGGQYYLASLLSRIGSSANIEYHAAILVQKYVQRETINICAGALSKMYDDNIDPFKEKNNIISRLEQLSKVNSTSIQKFETIVKANINRLDKLSENNGLTGINTGYNYLNQIFSGWQPTDLITIGARPSTGKTAFALNLIKNIIINKVPCAFFSLEMSATQLVDRVISNMTDIEAFRFKNGRLHERHWNTLTLTGFDYPLYIDDTAALSILDFKIRARKLVRDNGVKFIVVDYWQLMTTYEQGNREQQLGSISRGLKATAKELNVPIIALAQLGRDVEKSKREPILSDLRESGSIEQDSDIVMFLHNETDPMEKEVQTNVIIAKHRAGSVGKIPFVFKKDYQKFIEM